MSAEFSKLCKRLAIAATVAVLLPLGAAVLLTGASAAVNPDTAAEQADATPAPQASASLAALGRANAVAWIGPGQISAP